jgi:hypothetical protein
LTAVVHTFTDIKINTANQPPLFQLGVETKKGSYQITMASIANMAERKQIATQRFNAAHQVLARSVNSEFTPPEYTNQSELGFVQHLESLADLVEVLAQVSAKSVSTKGGMFTRKENR